MKRGKKEKRPNLKYQVRINWSEKDGAFVAEVPELIGCATHGATYEDAAKNVEDAIETWIDGAKESGYKIPEPMATASFSGKFMTRIRPELHREVSLKATEEGKSLNKFVEDALKEAIVSVAHSTIDREAIREELRLAIQSAKPLPVSEAMTRSEILISTKRREEDEEDCRHT